jgi:hypothetical protein
VKRTEVRARADVWNSDGFAVATMATTLVLGAQCRSLSQDCDRVQTLVTPLSGRERRPTEFRWKDQKYHCTLPPCGSQTGHLVLSPRLKTVNSHPLSSHWTV